MQTVPLTRRMTQTGTAGTSPKSPSLCLTTMGTRACTSACFALGLLTTRPASGGGCATTTPGPGCSTSTGVHADHLRPSGDRTEDDGHCREEATPAVSGYNRLSELPDVGDGRRRRAPRAQGDSSETIDDLRRAWTAPDRGPPALGPPLRCTEHCGGSGRENRLVLRVRRLRTPGCGVTQSFPTLRSALRARRDR